MHARGPFHSGVDVLVTPCTCVRGTVISSVCLVVHLSTQKSPDLNIYTFERLISITNLSKLSKNWLHYTSNHLARPTSIANAAFSLATPIDSTHYVLSAQAYKLPQYIGKGRQLQDRYLISIIMQIDLDADATRAWGMCSTEF
jgi:hypothetical protein